MPDGLGGWHVVQVIQGGAIKAQVPFYVKRSFVGKGVSALVLKEGQQFTVHLKGLGWTQLDNTIAVAYDNSYVGYGCGFNSNGDVVMNIVATGGPGTHLIDMYPLLYTQQPSYANTPYGMIPVLTYAQDAPGLALGYQLPAIRLAITSSSSRVEERGGFGPLSSAATSSSGRRPPSATARGSPARSSRRSAPRARARRRTPAGRRRGRRRSPRTRRP